MVGRDAAIVPVGERPGRSEDIYRVVSLAATDPPVESSSVDAARHARFNELFGAHATTVFGFARRRTSRAEAEEVVSETFLVAWRRLDDVPSPPRPWLLGVARRVMANRRRSDARQDALRLRAAASVVEPPGSAEAPESEADAVLVALAELPPAEREAITLLAWEGLTPEEISVVLGCSRAAVYVRVHRARRRLAARLDAEADGPREEET
jgi:RNA polymerase sigma-70 factor (ECF subfamily)